MTRLARAVCDCGWTVERDTREDAAEALAGHRCGPPVYEVVLPDGFVSYRTCHDGQAHAAARRHPGATVRTAQP